MFHFLSQLDGSLLVWIQNLLVHDMFTPFFKFLTTIGNAGAVWIIISVILLVPKKTRPVGIISLIALCGSFIIDNMILKNLIARTRPYDVVSGVQLLIARPNDFSFPSGHTGSSFAAAVVLYRELPKKYGVPALILAALIGLSRIYLGVHYPSDVICGALFGSIIAIFISSAFHILKDDGNLRFLDRWI
ncbi:phosphatase PAP2 family protein [Parasporobacterium paucivorans]|uniref:Undecaprenyl-diphosphatase n=1 Tax=Parasporobacterium paucivorans DSM 15970 TaxID=1122934 RepID=A0A1M6IZ57_9FIRM|nr:phosphatase PAP2 family protein [Parasporobacterium paucivorans]SHJ39745.1 undecaprenyl-diphosphatase [Parasporobacterium paucivorans DSM 15970]